MNHGIILGGMLEREDTSETRNYLTSQDEKDKPDYWPGIKDQQADIVSPHF